MFPAIWKAGKVKTSWLIAAGIVALLFLFANRSSLPIGLFATYGEVSCSMTESSVKSQLRIPSSYSCSLIPIPSRTADCSVFCRDSKSHIGQECDTASECGFGEVCRSEQCVKDICVSGEQLTAYGCLPVIQKKTTPITLGGTSGTQTTNQPIIDLGKFDFNISQKTIQLLVVFGVIGLFIYIITRL